MKSRGQAALAALKTTAIVWGLIALMFVAGMVLYKAVGTAGYWAAVGVLFFGACYLIERKST